MGVAVSNALHQLSHELLHHVGSQSEILQGGPRAFRKRLTPSTLVHRQRLHVLLEIEIKEFEDKVELVTVGMYDVEEADNVGVVHLLQEGDFPDSGAGDALIFGL
jgi:hypothetical protein